MVFPSPIHQRIRCRSLRHDRRRTSRVDVAGAVGGAGVVGVAGVVVVVGVVGVAGVVGVVGAVVILLWALLWVLAGLATLALIARLEGDPGSDPDEAFFLLLVLFWPLTLVFAGCLLWKKTKPLTRFITACAKRGQKTDPS